MIIASYQGIGLFYQIFKDIIFIEDHFSDLKGKSKAQIIEFESPIFELSNTHVTNTTYDIGGPSSSQNNMQPNDNLSEENVVAQDQRQDNQQSSILRRSTRDHMPPNIYIDEFVYYLICELTTIEEALDEPNSDLWKEVMDRKYPSLSSRIRRGPLLQVETQLIANGFSKSNTKQMEVSIKEKLDQQQEDSLRSPTSTIVRCLVLQSNILQ